MCKCIITIWSCNYSDLENPMPFPSEDLATSECPLETVELTYPCKLYEENSKRDDDGKGSKEGYGKS